MLIPFVNMLLLLAVVYGMHLTFSIFQFSSHFALDRLYVSDLARLVKETIAAKEKWDKIGQELRVSEQYLAFIRTRYSTSHDRLVEMLRKRLKQSVITTWKDIVAALISDHVGELQLADQIKANLIGKLVT